MFYNGYYFGGMHILWWFVFIMLLVWIFALPYAIPGQRWKKDSPLDILKARYAKGEIGTDEYNERKRNLETNSPPQPVQGKKAA